MATARTQLRGTCPACFAQQALKNGKMVAHGYDSITGAER